VYNYACGPAENVEVLSCGQDPLGKLNWPVEWTVRYGQGRVYVATFGHVWSNDVQPVSMRCAGVQALIVRCLRWLARRPVSYPVPADFPSAEKTSIRPEIAVPQTQN
jgi:type 1 glutamine amidotransferase